VISAENSGNITIDVVGEEAVVVVVVVVVKEEVVVEVVNAKDEDVFRAFKAVEAFKAQPVDPAEPGVRPVSSRLCRVYSRFAALEPALGPVLEPALEPVLEPALSIACCALSPYCGGLLPAVVFLILYRPMVTSKVLKITSNVNTSFSFMRSNRTGGRF